MLLLFFTCHTYTELESENRFHRDTCFPFVPSYTGNNVISLYYIAFCHLKYKLNISPMTDS